jgi:hypothetical protein
MTLSAIWALIVGAKDQISIGFIGVIILASLIQVSKININPWDAVFNWIGKKLNKELLDKVKDVETKLDKHIADDDKEKLEAKRRDILSFANSCMNGRKHTKEQFIFVIKECDEYEAYIEANNVKNGEITSAMEEIRRLYKKCLQQNSFLQPGEEFE